MKIHLARVANYTVHIFIAGDYDSAVVICRKFCMVGLCVSVVKTRYIYTAGAEDGVCVSLINYARFPSTPAKIVRQAERLGKVLMRGLCQRSFSITTPTESRWYHV